MVFPLTPEESEEARRLLKEARAQQRALRRKTAEEKARGQGYRGGRPSPTKCSLRLGRRFCRNPRVEGTDRCHLHQRPRVDPSVWERLHELVRTRLGLGRQ